MIELATAINSFASPATQNDFVPPSEEQIFVLSSSHLQAIIEKTTEGLKSELSDLRAVVAKQGEEIAALKSTEAALKEHRVFSTVSKVEDLWEWVEELDKRAETKPQPLQKDRADVLHALLAANNGKMLLKDARRKMHLKKNQFSELLTICDFVSLKPYHLDSRQKIIILKSELVQQN